MDRKEKGMSHILSKLSFPEKTSKAIMVAECEEKARREGGQLHDPIRWIDRVFDDYDQASDYIDRIDSGHYDQIAVKYRSYDKIAPSATLTNLEQRRDAEIQKRIDYAKKHSVSTFKADYVGCPSCGSRLKRELLSGEYCPLCRTDLRGKTTLDTLAKYSQNIEDLKKKISAEQKKLEAKNIKNSKINWLVKIEFHV